MSEDVLAELVGYEGPDRVVHFTDYLLDNVTKSRKSRRFNSKFLAFDEKCGLESGEVVVISGHTKAGKTLFAESWVRSMCKIQSDAKAVIFSFEIQPERMLTKYVKDEKLPIYVPLQLFTMDFDWLRNRCQEAKLKHGCSIVLIDHLHFMVDMATKQNMSLNIGAFMRRLKSEIALGFNMGVILIAHQQQQKESEEASLHTLRDSSFVAQESDAVVIVRRKKNLDSADLMEMRVKYGEELVNKLSPPPFSDNDYSSGLAIVKVACHRRTGAIESKKLFHKVGDFLEEV